MSNNKGLFAIALLFSILTYFSGDSYAAKFNDGPLIEGYGNSAEKQ